MKTKHATYIEILHVCHLTANRIEIFFGSADMRTIL